MSVTILRDHEYLPRLLQELSNAKKEVLAIIYLCKYTRRKQFDHAKRVIVELIRCFERGVEVKVIFQVGQHKRHIPGWNLKVYEDLKKLGMNVKVWKERRILHAKAILIDENILFIGSHNLSNCSLRESAELSTVIVDEETGRKAKASMREYWKKGV